MVAIIIGIILVVLILAIVGIYNSLVQAKLRVDNAWAQIDTQLKRRFDLIPNLVETVKGYAKHESETLEKVIAARNSYSSATTEQGKAEADNMLSNSLKSIFALAESYPELKANENFLDLQANLKDSEDKITFSRQFYNDTVLTYQNNGVDYVIYKDDDNVHYIAKYNYENEELNTYLSDEEISFGEQVLNEVIDEVGSK